MQITINALELAEGLAHQSLLDEISLIEDLEDEKTLYNFDENGVGNYKPEYQDIFNRWYDYYFESITNLAL